MPFWMITHVRLVVCSHHERKRATFSFAEKIGRIWSRHWRHTGRHLHAFSVLWSRRGGRGEGAGESGKRVVQSHFGQTLDLVVILRLTDGIRFICEAYNGLIDLANFFPPCFPLFATSCAFIAIHLGNRYISKGKLPDMPSELSGGGALRINSHSGDVAISDCIFRANAVKVSRYVSVMSAWQHIERSIGKWQSICLHCAS